MKGYFARSFSGLLLVLITMMMVGGCASVGNGPRTVALSEPRLQSLIEKKLNADHTLLTLFEIRLAQPQVKVHPDVSRIQTDMDVYVKNPLSGGVLKGKMAVSGGLDWDADKKILSLVRLRAESFSIEGLPSQYSMQINQLGTLLAEQFLKDFTVYETPAEGVQLLGRAYDPSAFHMKEGMIEIVLNPRAG